MNVARHEPQLPQSCWVVVLLVGAAFGELLWFGMLYPLVPKTGVGWLLGAAAGVCVGLWAAACALLIGWLQRQSRFPILCKAIGALIAVSLGVAIFWLALNGQPLIVANFSYFGR